ncbi:MAG: tRNA-binding protein [Burkholderiales bacterium]|jgi:tRNA-binding protein|nr:tRNA-binding protein [Burkholderiales bacterium]
MLENSLIQFEDFEKVQIHVGQIIEAKPNLKAIKPAYILTIDFGELGIKTSSAQLTQNYSIEDLIDKKIIAVVNFPVKKIAGVKSEVLVLATICNKLGTLLISADSKAINGSRIK